MNKFALLVRLVPICAALAVAACNKPEVVAPPAPVVVTVPQQTPAPDDKSSTVLVPVPVPGPQGPQGVQGPQGEPGTPAVNNPGDSTNRMPDR